MFLPAGFQKFGERVISPVESKPVQGKLFLLNKTSVLGKKKVGQPKHSLKTLKHIPQYFSVNSRSPVCTGVLAAHTFNFFQQTVSAVILM
ncbi:hypothetical protein [Rufibacter sp. LB8]|uniref:hypothetical protein n=1 Tax=Rufibacter sp. LB8 TaxID=2777781 RepID=UPI00178C4965|nr:hypothetical protein [Rufibacter sp. LB8]